MREGKLVICARPRADLANVHRTARRVSRIMTHTDFLPTHVDDPHAGIIHAFMRHARVNKVDAVSSGLTYLYHCPFQILSAMIHRKAAYTM